MKFFAMPPAQQRHRHEFMKVAIINPTNYSGGWCGRCALLAWWTGAETRPARSKDRAGAIPTRIGVNS